MEDYQVNQEDECSSDSEDPFTDLSDNSSDVESDTFNNDD